ncbi:PAS domain-containing protein [Streptomyces sp. NBC_01242]|uniref:PAS domain-containing protein n=1 Tax=unclassified Streptomyces TaxID=2593676 RepID=UPI0022504270|nr:MULTISPECIES: PAS domain-containing protein [unclassified Streptomyces]MCX4796183.1 PAS domain-containing protein [Streptomyces sp. NBC_01242]WSJ37436.1 PAS domain-containing protein [Streptomyces sp. NBC_01321]WSP56332.1 PAS domain-containing protein [Streptomyces sp. NBC_01241]
MSSRPSRGAARLAAILDALPDGLLLVNCNGTVVNANTIALEMFETPGTALVGRGLLDLLPEFDSTLIPGSMRRPESADDRGRTKPTRMTARRTDGTEYPVEVTSASLEDGQAAYNDFQSTYSGSYTGDELLMLVVRDLSGTVDTEAELARSQRQTEMILRAAAEGVVGTDTDGRVVLVNPAAAQILGFRASDLGGQDLHPLILHSRAEGEPFPYEESPLADTLRSGRKHRVRGQVLWSKSGAQVPVDLTTAPVRDGDQLVGAVMTFTDRRPYEELAEQHRAEVDELTASHTAEVTALTERHSAEQADRSERYTAELEAQAEQLAALTARHTQLTAVLGESLRGPLEELRGELSTLAADPAGQLWPEANQILHHLAAGYARMTTLVDNVLGYQRLDAGSEDLVKANVLLDSVVTAGIDAAVELIGPGRAQFAVHAPPIEAEVDAARMVTALAHLVADVAGVDSTGKARVVPGGGYVDSTVVVAAAQRGEVVRIEVRGPFAGGDPVHEPIVRGIVRAHGGVLQTHEVPGMSGSAYVLEVPLGKGSGTVMPPAPEPEAGSAPEPGSEAGAESMAGQGAAGGGRRRGRRASTDAFLESPVGGSGAGGESGSGSGSGDTAAAEPTGRRRARREPAAQETPGAHDMIPVQQGEGSGRRRGRPSPAETGTQHALPAQLPEQGRRPGEPADEQQGAGTGQALALPPAASAPSEGAVVTAAEGAQGGGGRPQRGRTVPPQGVPVPAGGHRAHQGGENQLALPAPASASAVSSDSAFASASASEGLSQGEDLSAGGEGAVHASASQPTGRRARRALAAAQERSAQAEPAGPRTAFALPPADADRIPPAAVDADASLPGRHDAVRIAPDEEHTPPQAHPVPTGRRRARHADAPPQVPQTAQVPQTPQVPQTAQAQQPAQTDDRPDSHPGGDPEWPTAGHTTNTTGTTPVTESRPRNIAPVPDARRQPLPAEAPMPGDSSDSTQGRAFSVRTLGQGVPFAQHIAHQQNQTLGGAGRRRKLAAPPEDEHTPQAALPQAASAPAAPSPAAVSQPAASPAAPSGAVQVPNPGSGQLLSAPAEAEGRAYAIGAPDEGAEGPEPLDGPGGAVEVANRPSPQPVDDELPPEPLDNPRRLLVWPAPDVSTQQALSDRGYRPVIVHSREEVDAQIAAFPAALFVDPLTGPITRKALQSLRQAAVAAEVPVLVTAGLGQATREAAYGADPAVLLKALAPRDSEQHPPRVLLIEEHEEIALALTDTLERRGMQVARASTDNEAVTLATRMRPNLVVMDLMQVRRRRAGIVDWLRANGQLNRTPLVVYTSADMTGSELPKLGSGETVLFLAERSTSDEVQSRIVDLLAKIGTN